jgi:dipeptidase
MCDTIVMVEDDAVWLAKNSDREPGEAQAVEHVARTRHAPGARLQATYLAIDQARETHEVVIARPAWMWGAEMGANEHGLAIGNEAVFTRVPVARAGLLGMDLLRLALERCASADEALELITWMIARHGQGGGAGFRNRRFTYHNAFLIADPRGAWLLETAGRFWAAVRVARGVRTISNVLTIGADYTRVGPDTIDGARAAGLLRRGQTFDFRRCFGARVVGWLGGGDVRRACTLRAASAGRPIAALADALRDHAGRAPASGARMLMPCAHASWLPTRGAGQTTGTMISRLARGRSQHFFTGTSAPCLSVLKPVPLGQGPVDTGPRPGTAGFDGASLFWRAERLHRVVLRDYEARRAAFEAERAALEARALARVQAARTARAAGEAAEAAEATGLWHEHREAVLAWTDRALRIRSRRVPVVFDAWWRVQSRRDRVPGGVA